MSINQQKPEPLSNDYYFLLQSLIYDSNNDLKALEDQIISLVQKGSQATIKYIEFLLSKTSKIQFWKIPSLYHLSLSLESHLKIKLKLDHLLSKFIKYNETNPNGSFPEFCVDQTDEKWKDIIRILSTDDSEKLTETQIQNNDKIIFDSRNHNLIDLLFEFRSEKCIQKFQINPTKVDLKIAFKILDRKYFEDEKPGKYFPYYSRQSWFFDIYGSALSDYFLPKYNYTSLILPTKIAKKFYLYGPNLVRKEVRRSIFGEETSETYNKLVHYSDLIWQKEKNFEFEENLSEPFIITLLNNVISLYCVNNPKEYEYVLFILKKISHKINEKIFHSLNDYARPLKPMLIKIDCDFRTQTEKDCDFYPYEDEFQVHDRDFFDYFHKNHPGFTKDEFVQNREKIFDIRFCFGFGYSFYEDNVEEFIKIYNSDAKNDVCYDMCFEELYLIDVAAWFGAEKIYNYLKNECNKKLCLPHLAVYGGNENIINDCLNMEMNNYQRTSLVSKLLLGRKFDLAIRICEKNDVDDINIFNYMFVPLDVIKRIKNAKLSAMYSSIDDVYLVSYWLTFIEENNLEADIPSGKIKLVEINFSDNKEKNIPKKLIL